MRALRYVLDSWAVLELLSGHEPTATQVKEFMASDSSMSWLNLGEVMYIVQRARDVSTAREVAQDVRASIAVRLPTEDDIMLASELKGRFPMAYADGFAAALSIRLDAPLVTGDPELIRDDAPWTYIDLRNS